MEDLERASVGGTTDAGRACPVALEGASTSSNEPTPELPRPHAPVVDPSQLPYLLTADEAAALLRTTRRAVYARAERGLLPGIVYDGRRLLVRRDVLLRSLTERRTASPGGTRR
jgi:hypothetical protein